MYKTGIQIISEDLSQHPYCSHGPTVLFSRITKSGRRNFYACSACRDRKSCSFFLWQDEKPRLSDSKGIHAASENSDRRKQFMLLNKIKQLPPHERTYCLTCDKFQLPKHRAKHENHNLITNLSDRQLGRPSEWILSLNNDKKEAQYLFSNQTVEVIMGIFKDLGFKKAISVCTPRLHEFFIGETEIESFLLDIDARFSNFFGPLEYSRYNCFNNHFFERNAREIFCDYLKCNRDGEVVLIIDPPFGGRVELLADTLEKIGDLYQTMNNAVSSLPIFWIFPYFMEPHIINRLPDFTMLDYKVNYDNHMVFSNGEKGRKQGSPVRIFTNTKPSLIKLPKTEGYKYCRKCNRWVSPENTHCKKCNACTSKDGRTYVHCDECRRCVKPTWRHCEECEKCALERHDCLKDPLPPQHKKRKKNSRR